jgi:hypothetical protein
MKKRLIEIALPLAATRAVIFAQMADDPSIYVETLLRELKRAGQIKVQGTTKAARWFPAGSRRNPTQ